MKRIHLLLLSLIAVCGLAVAQSNVLGTLLTSASRTTTTTSADVVNTSYRGAHVYVNVSAYVSGTWTPVLQGKDPVTNNYYDICTGPTISGTGVTIMKIYPGMFQQTDPGSNANVICNDFLPRTWRIQMTGASSPSATYSVGYLGEF